MKMLIFKTETNQKQSRVVVYLSTYSSNKVSYEGMIQYNTLLNWVKQNK